jgi:hypothetical protein
MDGTQILLARKSGGVIVTQEELRRALKLKNRMTISDVESGGVDVTDAWVFKAIAAIEQIKRERQAA